MTRQIKPTKIAVMLRSVLREPLRALAPIGLLTALATPSWAMEIETDVPGLKIRWDNTLGYSLGIRTARPSEGLTTGHFSEPRRAAC